MNSRSEDPEVLLRYLLGELPDTERTLIEQRFFADEDYYEQLLAVEDELRYDFVQGRLSAARRESFERRFLGISRDRNNLDFPGALLSGLSARKEAARKEAARNKGKGKKELAQSTQQPGSDFPRRSAGHHIWAKIPARLDAIIAANPMLGARGFRLAFSATGVILVAAFGLMIQRTIAYRSQLNQIRQEITNQRELQAQIGMQDKRLGELAQDVERERSRRLELENEVARQNEDIEQMGQKLKPSGPLLSLILSPGLTRDSGSLMRLALPSNAQRVRLQLNLRGTYEYQSYIATIRTAEGKTVWSQRRLRRAPSGSREVVFLNLPPGGVLAPGDYEVGLDGSTPGAAAEYVDTYYFTIVKK